MRSNGKMNANGTTSAIVQRIWSYCNVLRDAGLSYGDYLEQLTYLLFLKMAAEQEEEYSESLIPPDLNWQSLQKLEGEALEKHYRHILSELGSPQQLGVIRIIFQKAQNKIQEPAKLKRLVELIAAEKWMGLGLDVKGAIYEGLLEKNAQDTKSGAGQYFTPRPLIEAIVEVMRPQPGETICDPACGTGGFLLTAHTYVNQASQLDEAEQAFLDNKTLWGWEIVENTARLCMMNLYLHGIARKNSESPIRVKDSLVEKPVQTYNQVMTNPPFGKKSSVMITNAIGEVERERDIIERDDFWATTTNKQLNFLQHIKSLLKINGKAAVIIPDNVLFEGGAGEIIRRRLLQECDVHTLVRLPTGIFYAHGVKANILFFDRKPASDKPWTSELWIYDFRTNKNFTLKNRPLQREDLTDFEKCFQAENRLARQVNWNEQTNSEGRWRMFTYEELLARDKANLDIFWLKDKSLEDNESLPEPEILAAEIIEDIEAALEQFREVLEDLTAI